MLISTTDKIAISTADIGVDKITASTVDISVDKIVIYS